MDNLLNELTQMQWLEIVALVLALGYVVLAARGSQWCWPLAFTSTAIYTTIFWQSALVSESLLNTYYMAMAIVGWISWNRSQASDDHHQIAVQQRNIRWHIIAIGSLCFVSIGWGWLMHATLEASYPYIDSFTTVFALFATWLLTQRIRENWLYWIVIDAISIWLYQSKGLWISSLLMVFYTVFAIYGWHQWGVTNKERTEYANA